MTHDSLVVEGPGGRVELTGAALASLATRAAEAIAGVHVRRPRRRLKVSVAPSAVRVELGLEAARGVSLPDLGEAVQRSVAHAVASATGLPTTVDVSFEELA